MAQVRPEIECVLCGMKFIGRSAYINTCPECKAALKSYKRITTPPADDASNDLRIKREAEERVKNNDRIVAEGYAERQIQDSLRLAGKIKTEL